MDFINVVFEKLIKETSSFILERIESLNEINFFINGHSEVILVNQEPWILFSQFEVEISENLLLPVGDVNKIMYINNIKEALSDNERKITLFKSYWFPEDISFRNCSKASLTQPEFERVSKFFLQIKQELRRRINQITLEASNLKNRQVQLSNSELKWDREKTDLIELVKALTLSRAFKIKGQVPNYSEAYQLFENIFNIELKNPEDQLRQRAEALDTPNFLEELLEKFTEDQKILKRKRNS